MTFSYIMPDLCVDHAARNYRADTRAKGRLLNEKETAVSFRALAVGLYYLYTAALRLIISRGSIQINLLRKHFRVK